MVPNPEAVEQETSKTCCCCGEEFHEQVESYAVICERCANVWEDDSTSS